MHSDKTAVGLAGGSRTASRSFLLLKGAALTVILTLLTGGAGAQTTPSSAETVVAETASVPSRAAAAVIDEYVREALHSNLSLHAESMAVEREFAA
ncbi:MAG: hypothetical protein JO299_04755, partial [Gammaproteobacteria bacterium]|nr:hypothetical protein [Gammaproteobacteria bacterium]